MTLYSLFMNSKLNAPHIYHFFWVKTGGLYWIAKGLSFKVYLGMYHFSEKKYLNTDSNAIFCVKNVLQAFLQVF